MGAVFLGTPAAAVPSLAALADVADVDLVVTMPDRPAGRGGVTTPSPVKVAATAFGFPVAQPETRDDLDAVLNAGFEFGLVVAFGRILTPAMLTYATSGYLNVHFSLLPRWRGAAPVEHAIVAGDERTGVSLMQIDEGLDTGPIIGEIATPIGLTETGGSLTARLAHLGAALVDALVPDYLSGRRRPVPQLDTDPVYAAPIDRADARLDPAWGIGYAERAVRAFTPRPGAWCDAEDGPLLVHRAVPSDQAVDQGTIARAGGLVVAGFADGALALSEVQPAGKARMPAAAWMNGRRGEPTTFSAERT